MTEVRDHRTGEVWTRLAAFGDSLIWGQGLLRNRRFSRRIAALLPKPSGSQRSPGLVYDQSRSGAQIYASAEQRNTFVDRFPYLFPDGSSIGHFLDGSDESPASGLYGESRAPFPTVLAQVAMLPDAIAGTIDLALVDGGINDVDFISIINPQEAPGKFVERFGHDIRRAAYDHVGDLIKAVRAKCPNAIILYFGAYPIVSHQSADGRIRSLIRWELNNDVKWILNEIFNCKDVGPVIFETQTRGVWLQGLWQYWTRLAVVDANRDDAVRGSGVLFVPSGFGPENAAFTPSEWIFDRYRDPVGDPAQPVRRSNIPRIDHLDAMQELHDKLFGQNPVVNDVRDLEAVLNGPSSLKATMLTYADDPRPNNQLRLIYGLLDDIKRMQTDLIASLAHPNNYGAASYANNAIRRLSEYRAVLRQIRLEQPLGRPPVATLGQAETLDAKLRRYRLRGTGSLYADITHLDVDSLTVRTVTDKISGKYFYPNVLLVVTTQEANGDTGRRLYQLNMDYRAGGGLNEPPVIKLYPEFEPGTTSRFTVDTMGTLRLDEIMGCAIVVGDDPFQGIPYTELERGRFWWPKTVMLEVNGQLVVNLDTTGQAFGFASSLDLSYPSPQPNFELPKLAPQTIQRPRQSSPLVGG